MTDQGGGPERIEPRRVLVLYERRNGTIAATHAFAATRGGALPGGDALRRIALDQARRDGLARRGELEVLEVEPGALEPGVDYRVSRDGQLVPRRSHGPRPR